MKLVLAFCLALPSLALAGGNSALVGAATVKCSKYKEVASKGSSSALVILISWTQGYVSGINVERMNSKRPPLALPDWEQIRAWHDKYCEGHPDDLLYESSDAFVESLKPVRSQ